MKCTNCSTEFSSAFCPRCGAPAQPTPQPVAAVKKKKPFFMKWWFIIPLALILIVTFVPAKDKKKAESFVWDELALSELLPSPPLTTGKITMNTDTCLKLDVFPATDKQYNDYVKLCKEKGYTVDPDTTGYIYMAYNSEGYELKVIYYENSSEISISLDVPEEMSEISWPVSTAAEQLPLPEELTGIIRYEHEESFLITLRCTRDAYEAYTVACSEKGFSLNYDKSDSYYRADNEEGWHLSLSYKGNTMDIEISLPEDEQTTEKDQTAEEEQDAAEEQDESATEKEAEQNGISTEFKQAMDSYEEFINDYTDFMKKYSKNPGDLSLIADYADYAAKYTKLVAEFEAWDNTEMTDEELVYYAEVQARVTKKLTEILS